MENSLLNREEIKLIEDWLKPDCNLEELEQKIKEVKVNIGNFNYGILNFEIRQEDIDNILKNKDLNKFIELLDKVKFIDSACFSKLQNSRNGPSS